MTSVPCTCGHSLGKHLCGGEPVPCKRSRCRCRKYETADAVHPYRLPDAREQQRKLILVGRMKTAFGRLVGDANALDLAEWVVAGYPWELGRWAMCGSDITLRDRDHTPAVCDQIKTHTDEHHDSKIGVTWTDATHPAWAA